MRRIYSKNPVNENQKNQIYQFEHLQQQCQLTSAAVSKKPVEDALSNAGMMVVAAPSIINS